MRSSLTTKRAVCASRVYIVRVPEKTLLYYPEQFLICKFCIFPSGEMV